MAADPRPTTVTTARAERATVRASGLAAAVGNTPPGEEKGERSANIRFDPGPPSPGLQPFDQAGSGLGLAASAVVAALVFLLAIFSGGDPRPDQLPLTQTTGPLFWLLATVAVVGAGAAAQFAERAATRAESAMARPRPERALTTAWIVPSLATMAAVLLIATYHNPWMMVAGPVIAFFGSAGALLARDLLDDASDPGQRTAAAIHSLVILIVAFLLLSAVYLNKLPTPISSPLVALFAGLLTVETLERGTASRETRLLYAGLAGLALGEANAALNWWQTYGWPGGAVLFVCFYLASGVLLARTQRSTIRGRDLIEFGAVSLVAFLILAVVA